MSTYFQRASVSGAPVSGVAVSGGDLDEIVIGVVATQGADTVSAAATVAIAGAAAVTQGADTISAEIKINTPATAAVTQGGDTIAAAFTLSTPAVVVATQGADTATGASTVLIDADIVQNVTLVGVSGYAVSASAVSGAYQQSVPGSVVQAGDQISAAAGILIAGTAAITQGADTVVSPTINRISAAVSATQGAQTAASAATRATRPRLTASSSGSGPKWSIAA